MRTSPLLLFRSTKISECQVALSGLAKFSNRTEHANGIYSVKFQSLFEFNSAWNSDNMFHNTQAPLYIREGLLLLDWSSSLSAFILLCCIGDAIFDVHAAETKRIRFKLIPKQGCKEIWVQQREKGFLLLIYIIIL